MARIRMSASSCPMKAMSAFVRASPLGSRTRFDALFDGIGRQGGWQGHHRAFGRVLNLVYGQQPPGLEMR